MKRPSQDKQIWMYDSNRMSEDIVSGKNKTVFYTPVENFMSLMENVIDVLPSTASKNIISSLMDDNISLEEFNSQNRVNIIKSNCENGYKKTRDQIKTLDPSKPHSQDLRKSLDEKGKAYSRLFVAMEGTEKLYNFMHNDKFLEETYSREIEIFKASKDSSSNLTFIQELRKLLKEHMKETLPHISNLKQNEKTRER